MEINEGKDRKGLLDKLKNAVFAGLLAGAVFPLIVLLFLSGSNFRRVGVVLLCAAVILFLLKIIFDIVMEKLAVSRRLLANELFILFALLAFFGTTICVLAPALIFTPVHDKAAEQDIHTYWEDYTEELSVETGAGTMKGWLLHTDLGQGASGSAPVILYFGGNGEDSAYRIEQIMLNTETREALGGCDFVCFDYPGYGNSEGSASEKHFKEFGLAAYDYLASREDVSGVILMGYSLGTGVANYVASQREPTGLILMAPYADGYDIYNSYVNIFHGPLKSLATFKMNSAKFAKNVQVKPLILASKADERLPYESAQELFERYPAGCNFVTLDDVAHGEFWGAREVLAEINKYIDSIN